MCCRIKGLLLYDDFSDPMDKIPALNPILGKSEVRSHKGSSSLLFGDLNRPISGLVPAKNSAWRGTNTTDKKVGLLTTSQYLT